MTKKHAVVLFVSLVSTLVVLALLPLLSWHQRSEKITTLASQFQAPSDWRLEYEKSPSPTTCFIHETCMTSRRQWIVEKPLTKDSFAKLVKTAGWKLPIEGDCKLDSMEGTFIPLCTARGIVDNANISFTLYEDSFTHTQSSGIIIKPLHYQ